jgi:hypothetical protein
MEPRNDDANRATDEVVARLRARGVNVTSRESTEDLVDLLDAVEDFEDTVESRGGDLMVDEPIGSRRAAEPDNAAFVLPPRNADESIAAYIRRIAAARDRAAQAPPREA